MTQSDQEQTSVVSRGAMFHAPGTGRKYLRDYIRGGSPLCSKCKTNPHAPNQRYCHPCKASYMRVWRRK